MALRRIRPQLEDYDGEGDDAMSGIDSEGEREGEGGSSSMGSGSSDSGSEGSEEEGEDEDEDGDEEETPQAALSTISFSALAKAQKSISKSKPHHKLPPITSHITTVKSQLAALKGTSTTPATREKKPRKTREELKRTSKHAPQELTSKRAVTRRREIVAPILTAATLPRDPRFDDAVKGVFDERVFKRNYSFLEGYREDEMKMLKMEMGKTKDEGRKGELKKLVVSMESKKQQQERKERAAELAAERKKKEREAIKQGKKPFYLKKAEQKKMLLLDKYAKLSETQLDKVVEKKRKRKAQKEHKNIPFVRREA